jgi:hypothetical protein
MSKLSSRSDAGRARRLLNKNEETVTIGDLGSTFLKGARNTAGDDVVELSRGDVVN